ncbi:hypothetical protein HC823_02145 [Candidatus Gracilibacteria bacterium]|nr:hypothetical protein [Candidatus Gracilibacteria bacterium]
MAEIFPLTQTELDRAKEKVVIEDSVEKANTKGCDALDLLEKLENTPKQEEKNKIVEKIRETLTQ